MVYSLVKGNFEMRICFSFDLTYLAVGMEERWIIKSEFVERKTSFQHVNLLMKLLSFRLIIDDWKS